MFGQRVAGRVELGGDIEDEAEQDERTGDYGGDAFPVTVAILEHEIRQGDLLMLGRLFPHALPEVEPHHRVGAQNPGNHPQRAQTDGVHETREAEDDPRGRRACRVGESGDEGAEAPAPEEEVRFAAVSRCRPKADEDHHRLVGDERDEDDGGFGHRSPNLGVESVERMWDCCTIIFIGGL